MGGKLGGRTLAEWVHLLEDRIAAAKSRFDENHSAVTEDDKSTLASFERRCEELRATAASEGASEIDLNGPEAAPKTLQNELDEWVADLDRRYNRPARRVRNVSM